MKKSELAIVFLCWHFADFSIMKRCCFQKKHSIIRSLSFAPGGSVRAAAGQNADWLPRALFPRQRC